VLISKESLVTATTVTLAAEDVRAAVPMSDAIDAIRHAFLDLEAGAFEQPTRTSLRDGQFLVMSAHHKETASAMVKTLSLNFERTPAISGTVVWSETANPNHLVADAISVTTLRTGAIVGVATDLLADPKAERMALIGAGGQGPDQIRAVHAVRPLRSVTIVDRDHSKAAGMAENLSAELAGVNFGVSTEIASAVSDVDIVCCATPATDPLFEASALPAHVHVNAIGAFRPTMRELPSELLGDATVLIDEKQAILEESGEVLHALDAGLIGEDDLIELGSALRKGIFESKPRTVFKTVGVAAQDWAIAQLLAKKFLPNQ
jgi:ornithine cyclodeaminase/alanine dehydrogenase-like protein (mu-crystallin family)